MARKRVTEPQLKSWTEVDECLKRVSDAEDEMEKIKSEMNSEIAKIKEEADGRAGKFKEIIKQNEGKIKEYTTIHRDELKGKSRQLTFGTVGFRKSTKLLLPSAVNDVIDRLRERGMLDCIITKETVDKDAVKKYSRDDITSIGGYLQETDTFWYETEKASLAPAE